jgi:hypothetical protein
MASLITGKQFFAFALVRVHVCAFLCVFIVFDISSIDHLISMFHRLHFYLDRFE